MADPTYGTMKDQTFDAASRERARTGSEPARTSGKPARTAADPLEDDAS
jgi:hypothetical protein